MKTFLDNFIRKEVPLDGPKFVSSFYTNLNYPNDINRSWNEGEIPEVSVTIEQFNIQLKEKQVSSKINSQQIRDLDRIGIDGKLTVKHTLYSEQNISEIKEILRELKLVSKEYHRFKKYDGIEKWFYDLIGFKPLKNIHRTDMMHELIVGVNHVYNNSRRGPAQFAIVSKEILYYLIDSPIFVFADNTNAVPEIVSYVGWFPSHNLHIYETFDLDKCEIILGRMDDHSGIISVKTPAEYLEPEIVDYIGTHTNLMLTWWGQVTSTPNSDELYLKFKYTDKTESLYRHIGNLFINSLSRTPFFQIAKNLLHFKSTA